MKPNEAISFFKAGLEANPTSFVLNFLHDAAPSDNPLISNGSAITQQSCSSGSGSSARVMTSQKEFAKRQTEL
ncbi:hypothetical protein BU17DRAFT_100605 [Hysterangium stoloniferum]|nr:hypothetical protein BU17DRAFT_100605 [Hysterangium stoloniferum]